MTTGLYAMQNSSVQRRKDKKKQKRIILLNKRLPSRETVAAVLGMIKEIDNKHTDLSNSDVCLLIKSAAQRIFDIQVKQAGGVKNKMPNYSNILAARLQDLKNQDFDNKPVSQEVRYRVLELYKANITMPKISGTKLARARTGIIKGWSCGIN